MAVDWFEIGMPASLSGDGSMAVMTWLGNRMLAFQVMVGSMLVEWSRTNASPNVAV